MIVAGEPVAHFVSEQLGFALCPPYTAMGLADEVGQIRAGVIFHYFEGANIYFTAAGKGWTRAFLKGVGEYAFDQLGCVRMTALTQQPEVAALSERLGGRVEGRLRNYYGPGRDGIVVGFLQEDWKWRKV